MNSHTLNPSRSHARPSRAARLVSLFRGHDDTPEAPDADFRDHGDGMTVTEALRALPAAPWAVASQPAQPEALDDGAWWGITELDNPPVHHRSYVPDALGLFLPAVTAPDPGPLADLGTCVIFRDTVRSVFVRQEEARGFSAPDVPWYERYAGLYRARTAEPVLGFGIADAAAEAHEEAKAALEANIRGRIDRITAPVEPPAADEPAAEVAGVTDGSDENAGPAEAETEAAA
jgi:hypothetical protein